MRKNRAFVLTSCYGWQIKTKGLMSERNQNLQLHSALHYYDVEWHRVKVIHSTPKLTLVYP
jgi:hypothetical protein